MNLDKERKLKFERLKDAVGALGPNVSQDVVRELIYASASALRQGLSVTTDEIEMILNSISPVAQ